MAFLRICLFAALNFAHSLQATKNPLTDFCRRWGHQTAEVDGRLYIDGGQVAWNPLSSNPLNYTNTWLLFSDLNSSTSDVGMPQQYANLTKNSSVPSVSGGVLWADEINKAFYLYGGEFYQDSPTDFALWAYDIVLNQWNETKYTSNVQSIQRVSYGAGAHVDELGVGFFYGGYLNNNTNPGWNGPAVATDSLIKYDYTAGTLNNNTGPDNTGRAEGQMVYLPASDGGLLIYFGGVEDPSRNGTFVGANMSTIHVYDISSSKWYTQSASGSVPQQRRQFCADATWADDRSSYNIYLYGGFGIGNNVTGFDDVYILTLPSFTWIRAWPTDNSTSAFPHGGCSANVVNRDQMLVIGGWFTDSDQCDSQNGWGQHNMNLGENGPASALWDKYNPTISSYFVPTPIISAVGGGPTGSATATKPATWDSPDLAVYFTRHPSYSARTATRTVPTSSSSPSSTGSSHHTSHVGAIAGGVVGGLAVLIAILGLILFCLHRKKKANKDKSQKAPPPPPAELAATSPVHEMASPGVAKYMSMQQPDPNHPAFAGQHSPHVQPHSPTSPYPPQPTYSHSPGTSASYPSPYQQNAYPQQQAPYSDNPQPYDPHVATYDSAAYPAPIAHHQRQYSYPTPTSPTHPSQQQQYYDHPSPGHPPQGSLVYYPPPPEPSHSQRSYSDHGDRGGSPQETQYSGTTEYPPTSTANTPAQFYASPNLPVPAGRESPASRGSVDSRRPVRGRFVEVDHM